MKLYFAYGANLNRDSMKLRCPAAQPVRAAVLRNWQLKFSGVATVVPSSGKCVYGAIWAITDECEQQLDNFEAYPWLYHKVITEIDGEEVMLYRMNEESPARPSFSYYRSIAQGYQDWNLPEEALAKAAGCFENDYNVLA